MIDVNASASLTSKKRITTNPDNVGLCKICGANISKPKRGPMRNTCSNACKQRLYRLKKAKPVTPLPEVLKPRNTPAEQAYTASSIAILSDSMRMSNPTFDWELAQQLAEDFCRPFEWVRRSLAACRDAGAEPQYFIDRYLHRMPIPMNLEVDQAFREVLDQDCD